ncbi:MAG: flagellar protein FlgN [Oscillospiraceae bacterium]|nr:flagellar protein FlgN [Oscillospiraceae bacterium]
MMRKSLEELRALLLEQKAILESMLKLSGEERQVIIAGESEKLEDIVRQGFRELSKLGQVEKKRATLHKAIAAEFGLTEQDLTVSVIAENAEPHEREAIVTLQKELTELIGQHSALNKENTELIKAHLEYSETMLELMVEPDDPLNNFYGGDGRAAAEKKKTTGFFNGQA